MDARRKNTPTGCGSPNRDEPVGGQAVVHSTTRGVQESIDPAG